MSDKKLPLQERMEKYPYLRSRFESIMDIVEDTSASVDTADEAEQLLIDEIREMGKEALHDWAVGKEKQKVHDFLHTKDGITQHSKKNFPGAPPSER